MKTSPLVPRLLCVAALAACKKDAPAPAPSTNAPPATVPAPSAAPRIGLVFDVGGRGDKSFNDAADRGLQRLMVAERHLVETLDLGAEAVDVFLLAAGRDGGEGAAVESPFEGDQPVALGMAVMGVILAYRLDAALHSLGA